MEKAPRARWKLAAEAACVALAVLGFYYTHFDLARTQPGGDFLNLFWPLKEFRWTTAVEAGVFPLWNPYIFLGTPHHAVMQHAVFYPIDWLFFWHSPMLPAVDLFVAFHCALVGIGAWYMVRRAVGLNGIPAMLAGIVFPCTAWFWGAQEHINQIAATAWMPWLLAVALHFARGNMVVPRFVALYAILGALQFSVGHPQAAFYTHVTSFCIVAVASSGALRSRASRLLLGYIGAGLLTACISGVQLLPALELAPDGSRHHHDPAWSYSYSMPPDLLLTYIAPHAFGSYVDGYRTPDPETGEMVQSLRAYNEYGLYVGLPVLVLAVVGFAAMWGRNRAISVTLVAAIAATLLLAMGGNVSFARISAFDFTEFPRPGEGSLHDLVVAVVPFADGFRVPARIVIITTLIWTVLAAFGLQVLMEQLADRLKSTAIVRAAGAAGIAVCLLALYLPSRVERFRHPIDLDPLYLQLAEDERLLREPSIDDRVFRLTTGDHEILVLNRELETELSLGVNTGALRQQRLAPNMNVPLRIPLVEGYEEGLAPTIRTKDFLFQFNRNLRSARPDMQLLSLLGVGRVYSDLPIDEAAYPRDDRWTPARPLYSVPTQRGAAFWRANAEGVDLGAFEGPAWPDGRYEGSRNTEPVEYGRLSNWGEGPLLMTDVTDPNTVRVRFDGMPPGDALLAMGWRPGWELDGREVEWINAVHAVIPSGSLEEGEVLLEYRPAPFRTGVLATGLGLVIAFALLLGGQAGKVDDG